MVTVDEWLAEHAAKERARLVRAQAVYDARLKTTRASFASTCGQCRQSIMIGDVIIRPGGRRFANFWYCYWCGQIAHECDRPVARLRTEESVREEVRLLAAEGSPTDGR